MSDDFSNRKREFRSEQKPRAIDRRVRNPDFEYFDINTDENTMDPRFAVDLGEGNVDLIWDDLRVPVTSTTAAGSNPPVFAKFRDNTDPNTAPNTGESVEVNASSQNQHILVSNSASLDFSDDYAIEFWMYVYSGVVPWRTFMEKGSTFQAQIISGDRIRFNVSGYAQVDTSVGVNLNSWNHIVMMVDNTGGGSDVVSVYINGQNRGTVGPTFGTPGTGTGPLYIGTNDSGTSGQHVRFDEVRVWTKVLSAADITSLYNSGQGVYVPTNTTDLAMGLHLDEGTGTTAADYSGNSNDGTLTNGPTWDSGIVDPAGPGTGISRGVFTYLFPAGEVSELYFTAQMPHGYYHESAIKPHVHWAPNEDADNATQDVTWGLEYMWKSVARVYESTTTITNNSVVPVISKPLDAGRHAVTSLPDIPGDDQFLSSMLLCRIFRDGTDDDYPYDAALLEVDFHYQKDALGSRGEFTK